MATTLQREAGEAKGQPGLSTSHRANEAQLSMPPSRATSRPATDFSDRAFMLGYIEGLAESIRVGRYADQEAIAASLDYLRAAVQR